MNRTHWCCAVVLSLLSALAPGTAVAYDGRVIEAGTSRPMSDVWVIGRWEVGGGFVHGGGGCVLAIVKTGSDGSFRLESREGFLRSIWPLRDRPGILLYRPGYIGRDKAGSDSSNVFIAEQDVQSTDDRITHLIHTMSVTDCGWKYSYDHREVLRPLYQQIHAEVTAIAKTAREQEALVTTGRFLREIDLMPERQ